jgi:hypothetical protein
MKFVRGILVISEILGGKLDICFFLNCLSCTSIFPSGTSILGLNSLNENLLQPYKTFLISTISSNLSSSLCSLLVSLTTKLIYPLKLSIFTHHTLLFVCPDFSLTRYPFTPKENRPNPILSRISFQLQEFMILLYAPAKSSSQLPLRHHTACLLLISISISDC